MEHEQAQQNGLNKRLSYELFMLAVSFLSFINLVILAVPFTGGANDIIFLVDKVIAALFFIDFSGRMLTTRHKARYFFKQYGWADLLASVPLSSFNIFRIFRVIKFVHITRKMGWHNMRTLLQSRPADTALYGVFFLMVIVLEFGSIGVLLAEQHAAGANIVSAKDALWWAFVSITTVGYGDHYPITDLGKLVGVATLAAGVGLFGVITAYVANFFLRSKSS